MRKLKSCKNKLKQTTLFLAPKELAIKELQPATIPIPAETIIKYSGKAFAKHLMHQSIFFQHKIYQLD